MKGLFVVEIVRALQQGDIDLAVHSAKDLPAEDPQGVVVAAVPERAEPFDVLITREGELKSGQTVGTSSLRRQAQLRRARPEVEVRDLRGNVDTRLGKLERGEIDGLVLAAAGLARLGVSPPNAVPFPLDEMVPAPGQGALAVQARGGDRSTLDVAQQLDHERSRVAFEAERDLVRRLGGDCSLPLGAYAEQRENGVRLMAATWRGRKWRRRARTRLPRKQPGPCWRGGPPASWRPSRGDEGEPARQGGHRDPSQGRGR